jgi:hypothetical protein
MTDGLSLLDLADLPAPWRAVMRLIMREKSMLHDALLAAVSQLPDGQRLSEAELNDTLDELCRQGYLQQDVTDAGRRYQILVARKPGKQLHSAIWNALGVETTDDAPLRRGGSRTLSSVIWDTLDKKAEPTEKSGAANLVDRLAAYKTEPAPTVDSEKTPAPLREQDEITKLAHETQPRPARKPLWDKLDG